MVPIQNRSLSLRYPFKHNTKPAVSVPDLLTPNLVLCASTSSLIVRLLVRPLCPSVPYHGRISVVHMWQESVLLRGAISSATFWSTSGDKHKTCRPDVEVWVWLWFGVWNSILKPFHFPSTFPGSLMSQSEERRAYGNCQCVAINVNTSCKVSLVKWFNQIKFQLAALVSRKRGLVISPLLCKFYAWSKVARSSQPKVLHLWIKITIIIIF